MVTNKIRAGVNVIGYLNYGFGQARAAQYFLKALKLANIPCCTRNISANNPISEKLVRTDSCKLKYPVNLYFINPDSLKGVKYGLKKEDYYGKYEIGVWFWELEKFPDYFYSSFSFLDEIWVFTDFVYKSLSLVSPLPVTKISFPFFSPAIQSVKSIKAKEIIYLCIFDYKSDFERKNPLGAIKAFKRAFSGNETARLVIKSTNGNLFQGCAERLLKEIGNDGRITLIDEAMSRNEFLKLIASSHVVLSLHRSEGYGLNIIEAISMNKPVVVTAYGGNMEFLAEDYPFLVGYKKTKVKASLEFYGPDSEWALPDIKEAAEKMKWIFNNYEQALKQIKNFRKKILVQTGYTKTIKAFNKRIAAISTRNIAERAATIKIPGNDELYQVEKMSLPVDGKILLLFSAREERVVKILKCIRTLYPKAEIDIFGRKNEKLSKLSENYYCYNHEGFYKADCVDFSWFQNKHYDLAVVPFLNYSGSGYTNIFEIIKKIGIKKITGIGIEGDVYKI